MDRTLLVSELTTTTTKKKKTTRKRKSCEENKQPLKVVYISNPMRVHTSASEFRALVQELTGRDAEFPDPSKFYPASCEIVMNDLEKKVVADQGEDDEQELLIDSSCDDDFWRSSFESLEDILRRDVMENFGAISTSLINPLV
ncbi:sigma factor binding protein 2 [Cucumis melo var. makuwa]|uniref:Uncharacterized protein LOC103487167 n=2 Tax=Cucumis melo TaxID=3656 RepID=A0A1S3B8H6_CUCME|nr:uncharacterized protein LOC103487167 [Cucumis melo]KAA0053883.1 sigma factor binding protein 2 [Cucumis melo var. makuwa]TYK25522.1 sigma factor binding protein 2 [Cucumis melo var. makuwa]